MSDSLYGVVKMGIHGHDEFRIGISNSKKRCKLPLHSTFMIHPVSNLYIYSCFMILSDEINFPSTEFANEYCISPSDQFVVDYILYNA